MTCVIWATYLTSLVSVSLVDVLRILSRRQANTNQNHNEKALQHPPEAKIQIMTSVGKDVYRLESLYTRGGNVPLEHSLASSPAIKRVIVWSHNPAPRYLTHKKWKQGHVKTCIGMFITTPFIIAKELKPKCSSTDERKNKTWCIFRQWSLILGFLLPCMRPPQVSSCGPASPPSHLRGWLPRAQLWHEVPKPTAPSRRP